MKKMILFCLFVFLPLINHVSFAQFYTQELDSRNGDVFCSPPTLDGVEYRITVYGVYHQWPQSHDKCFGVDAVWYNDIPIYGNVTIDDIFYDIFKNPIWLGNDSVITIPSVPPIFNGFRIGLKQFTGFRINDMPLDQYDLDLVNHRYQFQMVGDGNPFCFQILDSVYSLTNEKTEPRYDDNSGSLFVDIEEVSDTTINICDMEIIDENGNIQIRLKAQIIVKDTNDINGEKNILLDVDQIGIVEDDRFICPDSIVCGEKNKYPVAVGILVDRSASMEEPVSDQDFSSRMNACKDAIDLFIDQLQDNDSCFVMSFSNSPMLEHDWSSDKVSLKNTINSLVPDSSTAFYSALLMGLEKVYEHNSPNKVIIALTDGQNTRGPIYSDSLINEIKRNYRNIPIFVIALSFGNSDAELKAIDTINKITSLTPKGGLYPVSNKDTLRNIYPKIIEEFQTDDCCSIYFQAKGCENPGDTITYRILFIKNGLVVEKTISYICPDIVNVVELNNYQENNNIKLNIIPNPFDMLSTVNYSTLEFGNVNIYITDIIGNNQRLLFSGLKEIGDHHFSIDGSEFISGSYLVVVKLNNNVVSRKIIVLH